MKKRHHFWKGNKADYTSQHQWIVYHNGRANKCENCGVKNEKRYEWANISGKYKRTVKDYKQLCCSCHRIMDFNKKYNNCCRKGHKFNKKNTYVKIRRINGKKRNCRICKKCQRKYSRDYKLRIKVLH